MWIIRARNNKWVIKIISKILNLNWKELLIPMKVIKPKFDSNVRFRTFKQFRRYVLDNYQCDCAKCVDVTADELDIDLNNFPDFVSYYSDYDHTKSFHTEWRD